MRMFNMIAETPRLLLNQSKVGLEPLVE